MTTAPNPYENVEVTFAKVALLNPWPEQPRPAHELVESALGDILPSIRAQGVRQSLEVRRRPEGGYWIVAGERRYRCAVIAGLDVVPVLIADMDDAAALKRALSENEHRKNLHPMSVARSLANVQQLDPECRSIEVLAAEVHRDVAEVRTLLRLLNLEPIVVAAFEGNAIRQAHARAIAEVPAAQQRAALEACFAPVLLASDDPRSIAELIDAAEWGILARGRDSYRAFERWLLAHVVRDHTAPEVQETIPEIAEAEAEAVEDGARLVQLSSLAGLPSRQAKLLGVVPRHRWVEIVTDRKVKKHEIFATNTRCEHMKAGVIVHGEPAPRLVQQHCSKRGCVVHFAPRKVDQPPTPETQERDQAVERAQRRAEQWERLRTPAREAFVAHLKKRTPKLLNIFRATTERWTIKQIEEKLGFRITNEATAAAGLVMKSLNEHQPESFAKVADACGFSLSKFTKSYLDAEKQAAAKSAKKAS